MSKLAGVSGAVDENRLRAELVDIAHRTYQWGYAVATDGNVSARLGDGTFLISPSGSCLGELTAEDLVTIDAKGDPSPRPHDPTPQGRPSSERLMHVAIYAERADVQAVQFKAGEQ